MDKLDVRQYVQFLQENGADKTVKITSGYKSKLPWHGVFLLIARPWLLSGRSRLRGAESGPAQSSIYRLGLGPQQQKGPDAGAALLAALSGFQSVGFDTVR
jgi:hypothetical protein